MRHSAAVPRFFVPADQVAGGRGELRGADAAHAARSLRVRVGEVVVLVDDGGTEHALRVDAVTPDLVAGPLEWSRPAGGEPRCPVHVLQALPQQGMDEALAALVEAGATDIHPVLTARAVARPEGQRAATRVERWRAVAREAAGLAHRGRVPDVRPLLRLDTALSGLPLGTTLLACSLDGAVPIAAAVTAAPTSLALVIGPEGGLSPEELAALGARGAITVHLGPRVLPARRAGAVAVALALQAMGDLAVSPGVRP